MVCIRRIYPSHRLHSGALLHHAIPVARQTIASPGCMDNLTGIGLNQEIAKHFSAHPEDLPENCRLICAAMACEESGLRGSRAFVKHHKDDGMLKIAIRSTSTASPTKITSRSFRATPRKCANSIWNSAICFTNPCRNSVLSKDGQNMESRRRLRQHPVLPRRCKTITFAAQNPIATNYYHTSNDKSDRLKTSVFEGGIEAVYRTIKKIGAKEDQKRK